MLSTTDQMPNQGTTSKGGVESSLALTEQERARIRAEEIYREEVREALTEPKKAAAGFIAFLNSPLGIFILSSLLLSGGTFLYFAI